MKDIGSISLFELRGTAEFGLGVGQHRILGDATEFSGSGVRLLRDGLFTVLSSFESLAFWLMLFGSVKMARVPTRCWLAMERARNYLSSETELNTLRWSVVWKGGDA